VLKTNQINSKNIKNNRHILLTRTLFPIWRSILPLEESPLYTAVFDQWILRKHVILGKYQHLVKNGKKLIGLVYDAVYNWIPHTLHD